MNEVVIGIDLGTQGVRVVAVTPDGEAAAVAHTALPPAPGGLPEDWFEQSPHDWWEAVRTALRKLTSALPPGTQTAGICVDSTSGTVLPIDAQGRPLHPALMYNDRRSEAQVPAVQAAGAAHQTAHGYVFGSSFALPKLVWLQQMRPEIFKRAQRFIHAADYILGKLSGTFEFSDSSNALKTGYNLIDLCWPAFIESELGISLERLPQVALPGAKIGCVTPAAAEETGLLAGSPLMAGATDGTAAQIASGAVEPGEWNSTLGTTLVLKGISPHLVLDPQGRVYAHRHPEGWWMPGGASNTGAEWIPHEHPQADPAELDRRAATSLPSSLLRYPLVKTGERFPFVSRHATGFTLGAPRDTQEEYAAGLEGVALLERLAYDMLAELGLPVGPRLFITGGGSCSELWSRVRASVLERQLLKPAITETAMGAAMLAASGCWYASLSKAAAEMVKIAQAVDPNPVWVTVYAERYALFVDELKRRGYLT